MIKRFLLSFAAILTLFSVVLPAFAADETVFELETYRDADNRLSVDLPKGWTEKKVDGMAIFMQKGLVFFGILDLDEADRIALTDALPFVIEKLKEDPSFGKLKTVEKPVLISGANLRLAHAKVAYVLNGDTDYISDLYAIGGSDGKARFGLVTYMPEDSQEKYRSLFESIVRSITISESAKSSSPLVLSVAPKSESSVVSEKYSVSKSSSGIFRDAEGRFSVETPSGWKEEKDDTFLTSVSDGIAMLGVMEVKGQYRNLPPDETLPEMIGELRKDTESFPNLHTVSRTAMLSGTHTAYARVAYDGQTPGAEVIIDLYVIGETNNDSRYAVVATTPVDSWEAHRSVYEKYVDSFSLNPGTQESLSSESDVKEIVTSKPATKESVDYNPVQTPKRPSLKPLYWIRNETQIVKDGSVIINDNDISSGCVSNDGKQIAFSRANKQVIVVNVSTGKRVSVYKVSGTTTVNYKDSGSEHESAYPVGFSPDGKTIYVMDQASSLFYGGNKLFAVKTGSGQAALIDKGVKAAAISKNGDILILKPGLVQFNGRDGSTWEAEPTYGSLFVLGCGFTEEGMPFYYTDSNVLILDGHGNEKKIRIEMANITTKPVVLGSTVVWDDGKRVASNEGGTIKGIGGLGSNREPFK